MVVSFSGAQTSQEFHSRYGQPDIERFAARPGISLTVEFGSDGLACRELIEPTQPLLHVHREERASFMSSEAVTELLEEIAPMDTRGKETRRFTTMSGCNAFEVIEYANVTITRSTHNCAPSRPDRETDATVTFKRDACQTQRK